MKRAFSWPLENAAHVPEADIGLHGRVVRARIHADADCRDSRPPMLSKLVRQGLPAVPLSLGCDAGIEEKLERGDSPVALTNDDGVAVPIADEWVDVRVAGRDDRRGELLDLEAANQDPPQVGLRPASLLWLEARILGIELKLERRALQEFEIGGGRRRAHRVLHSARLSALCARRSYSIPCAIASDRSSRHFFLTRSGQIARARWAQS